MPRVRVAALVVIDESLHNEWIARAESKMFEQLLSQRPEPLTDTDITHLTAFAEELADLAAEVIMPYFRAPIAVSDKPGQRHFDPVTIADQASEAAMRKRIGEVYPHHGIYGEEHGYEKGSSSLTWVLDPIDGTRAFITGLPLWGTLIALFDGQQPVLGVMNQPVMGERYTGNRHRSVCVDGTGEQELQTRRCVQLSTAIMMTTSPDMLEGPGERQVYDELVQTLQMQRFGGDCYAYCMLARGFVDLVVEADLQPYDIQALIPIVEGAGGVVTDWRGGPAYAGGQVIAAATPELHQQALKILSPAGR